MAHFAELDNNNIVKRVVVIGSNDMLDNDTNQESEEIGLSFCRSLFGADTNWVQTFDNGEIRGLFAQIGGSYDPELNVFNPAPAPEPGPPLPDPPQWVQFGAALAADTQVNSMVAVAATTAPVLHLMLGVGLGQAAQGDPQTFSTAWSTALGIGLVTPELATHVSGIGTTFNLPDSFIQELGAPNE